MQLAGIEPASQPWEGCILTDVLKLLDFERKRGLIILFELIKFIRRKGGYCQHQCVNDNTGRTELLENEELNCDEC